MVEVEVMDIGGQPERQAARAHPSAAGARRPFQ